MKITPKRAAGLLLSAFMATSCAAPRNFESNRNTTSPTSTADFGRMQTECRNKRDSFFQTNRVLVRIQDKFQAIDRKTPRGQTAVLPHSDIAKANRMMDEQRAKLAWLRDAEKKADQAYGKHNLTGCTEDTLRTPYELRKILKNVASQKNAAAGFTTPDTEASSSANAPTTTVKFTPAVG